MPRFLAVTLSTSFLLFPLAAQKRSQPKEMTFPEATAAAAKAYESQDYGAAVSALQEALKLAHKKQREMIVAALAAPEGWEAEGGNETEDNPFAAMAGLGAAVERTFRNGDKTVRIQVMANSPMVQMLAGVFSNPVLLQAQGAEAIEYGTHKAMLKKEEGGRCELQLLMHGKHVITVNSEGVGDEELLKIVDQKLVDRLEKPLGK
jgi:hypothetical protein